MDEIASHYDVILFDRLVDKMLLFEDASFKSDNNIDLNNIISASWRIRLIKSNVSSKVNLFVVNLMYVMKQSQLHSSALS